MSKILSIIEDIKSSEVERTVIGGWKLKSWLYSWLDRLEFDSVLLPIGFAQIDTDQDASYYGSWVNISELVKISYIEWDIYYIEFDTEAGLADNIRGIDGLRWIEGLNAINDQVNNFVTKYNIAQYE